MEQSIREFLEFNGKSIYYLSKDGVYYVALKPIVEALGLDWVAQFKAAKRNKILNRVLSNQTIHDASNRLQPMTCLPEKYVYGWIFQLQSNAPGFAEFQLKCYDLLYNYFHGTIAKRISTLRTRKQLSEEIAALSKEMKGTELGQRMEELKSELAGTTKDLKTLDSELSEAQIKLF